MPTEPNNGGFIADTPEKIAAFAALQLKARLRLEAAGMKGRGESALSQVRRLYGIKARTAKAAFPLYVAHLIAAGILKPE